MYFLIILNPIRLMVNTTVNSCTKQHQASAHKGGGNGGGTNDGGYIWVG